MKDREVKGAVPMIFLHGLADKIVPYNGINNGSSLEYFSALEHAEFMAERNLIFNTLGRVSNPFEGTVVTPEVNVIRDDVNISIREWDDTSSANADIVLITSKKGGHGWFRRTNAGAIDATKEIWEFFKKHPKP